MLLFILRLRFLAYHHYQARLPMFQYYVLLIGFALPTLYIARTVWNSIGGTNFSSWQYQIDWRYLVLAAPLAVAFVVIRYQTFHGSNKIILVVFALGITAFSASVGNAILQYGYSQLVGATDTVPLFIPLFILVLLASVSCISVPLMVSLAGCYIGKRGNMGM
ncbi:MAG: hypothetical protein IPL78_20970 [Chloroflexi bacterium]|nr:hypothetical protein [Chloroflexota bacterium]